MTEKFRKGSAGRGHALRSALHAGLAVLLAAALVGSLAVGPVDAALAPRAALNGTVSGSCTETDLDHALSNGGLITFACGGPKTIHLSTVKDITQNITLDGGDAVTLTTDFQTRLFAVNPGITLGLQHIVLDGAASMGSDGGAIANHGTLKLDHATIQHSQTDSNHSGGAIFSDGPVTINDSQLLGNTGGSAGAIFANLSTGVLTVTNSTFRDNITVNTVSGYGGAIWVGQQARLTLTGGTLNHNQARLGGAIYSISGTVSLSGSSLISNTATNSYGGGIDSEFGTLTLANTSFSYNSVQGYGGGVEIGNGVGRLTNVSFAHNAADYGGGLDGNGGQLTLTDTTFYSNTATNFGGGLATFSGAQGWVQGGSFTENDAVFDGGGVDNEGFGLTLSNGLFSNNRAENDGGGINNENSTLTLTQVTLNNNLAKSVGGGLANFYSTANVSDSSLSDNAAQAAGGIDDTNSTLFLTHVVLSHNHAHSSGGGLYNDHFSTATLSDTTFSDNTAAVDGAGIQNYDFSTVHLNEVTLRGNAALTAGGGLENDQSSTASLSSVTASGNSANFGAGIDNTNGRLTLTNTTLSGNTALKAGGGLESEGGQVLLNHVTLSGNSAALGGGLYSPSSVISPVITLSNTLIAAGPRGVNCFQVAATIVSHGYNLSSDASCAADFTQTGDLNSTNPHLGPLDNNGGPTQTHLPATGSPVIEAIPAGANGCGTRFTTDQRGAPRPINGRCDIGAVEAGWIHAALWLPLTRR
jgi:hypothetical protein